MVGQTDIRNGKFPTHPRTSNEPRIIEVYERGLDVPWNSFLAECILLTIWATMPMIVAKSNRAPIIVIIVYMYSLGSLGCGSLDMVDSDITLQYNECKYRIPTKKWYPYKHISIGRQGYLYLLLSFSVQLKLGAPGWYMYFRREMRNNCNQFQNHISDRKWGNQKVFKVMTNLSNYMMRYFIFCICMKICTISCTFLKKKSQ